MFAFNSVSKTAQCRLYFMIDIVASVIVAIITFCTNFEPLSAISNTTPKIVVR